MEEQFRTALLNFVESNSIDNPFNAKLSLQEINDFEQKYKVILPEEYKFFLNQVGNGGFGPGYGILTLEESLIDFKLDSKPQINLSDNFKYKEKWNATWIEDFDWDNERPELNVVNEYLDVQHISGAIQISHFGHGCTNLLILKGANAGQVWFDSRADYGGIFPEKDEKDGAIFNFFDWYLHWLSTSNFNTQ